MIKKIDLNSLKSKFCNFRYFNECANILDWFVVIMLEKLSQNFETEEVELESIFILHF